MFNYDMSLEMFHKTCPNQKTSVISCAIALLVYYEENVQQILNGVHSFRVY